MEYEPPSLPFPRGNAVLIRSVESAGESARKDFASTVKLLVSAASATLALIEGMVNL